MEKDIICIGHITKDKIITPQGEVDMYGGTAFYFSYGIHHLGNKQLRYALITSLADEDMKAVHDMRDMGIEVKVTPSRKTVYFENIYEEDFNKRTQRVRAKADPFTIDTLRGIRAKYIVLGTLLADDFSVDIIKHLSQHGTLAVDAQGYLREVRDENVLAINWNDKQEALQYIDILKVNEHEISVLTGKEDLREGMLQLAEWGVKEVLLTLGSYGSIIFAGGRFYKIPAYPPRKVVDATGCGDTYLMGYVYQRAQGRTISEAGCFAAAVSTIKLESSGPFCRSEEEAMEREKNSPQTQTLIS